MEHINAVDEKNRILCTEENKMEEQTELTPRPYQVALFKACLESNTIIFLPTGAGKTFIAIMVLKNMGGDLLGENHKVSIMLVNTVALVDQHVKYVQKHTSFECGGYSGEMNVDFWKPDVWHREFKKNQVLVMTSEIFAAIIRGKIFDPNKVNLLIFDECHHAVNDHSMRVLMKSFYDLTTPPRILGLTATLLNGNCKPSRVMDEVKSLEVTFNSKIATVDGLEVVVGYATNPIEYLILFPPPHASKIENECLELIDYHITTISLLKFNEGESPVNTELKVLEPVNDNKKLVNLMKDVRIHINMLGIYGGKIACCVGNIILNRYLYNCVDRKFQYAVQTIQTCLNEVINRFIIAMKDCETEKEKIHKYSSPKVRKLIEILKYFKEESKEELCGLVFVERRSTAKVLHHILESLTKNDQELSYINSDFIVGNSNNPTMTLENLFISKKNREVIKKFINKDTNLLFTSQVLEEGIDIPKCTFVCKFDIPKDYRSYIQSKGRARHKKSHYYIMVPQNDSGKFKVKYREYQEIEQSLNEYLIGRTAERDHPTEKEIAALYSHEKLKPFYVDGPGSAFIDSVSAISLLSRYCQTLQCDRYTVFAPEWYYESVQEGIVVTVYLPTVCPITEPIKGIPMRNKKLAKRAAAYEACIQLFLAGELTQTLLPKERTLKVTDVSFLFEHYPKEKEEKAGLKKKRLHDLQIPETIRGKITPEKHVYLHILNLKPLFTPEEDESSFFVSNLTYGFITPNSMPETCDFPLFIKNGTINVSVLNNVRTVLLSVEHIMAIRRFHFTIFNDVLNVLSECFILDYSDEVESLFLVPVNKEKLDIDFDVLIRNQDMICVEYNTEIEKCNMIVNTETYLNKIVYPFYRIDVPNCLVLAVCEDMTPKTEFPNESYEDFCDYYQQRHNTEIVNKSQPLLLVKALSKDMSLFKPVGAEKKRKWEENYEGKSRLEYFIPEIVGKREFPAELWVQGRLLPCILYRLMYMLRVETLWRKIGTECGFKIKDTNLRPLKLNLNLVNYKPSLDSNDKNVVMIKNLEESERVEAFPLALMSSTNKDYQFSLEDSRYPWKELDEPKDIERILDVTTLDIYAYYQFINSPVTQEQRKSVYSSAKKPNQLALTYDRGFVPKTINMLFRKNSGLVELADMYEAMTTAKAKDIVNLERLETLGDSFLKFITSFYIMLRFPDFGEGMATQLKGRMVSNKNLFYLAEKYNIGGILKNEDLRLKNGWIPPGFCIPESIRSEICDKVLSWKILNSLSFSTEEMINGAPEYYDFTAEKNDYNEVDTNDSYNNIDHYLKKQFMTDKCVADTVEAILGTYLLNTGFDGVLKVVQWMGVIPFSEKITEMMKRPVPSPILRQDLVFDIKTHLPLYAEIESILGYTFKNKALLLQAFTHSSYTPNRFTYSYERLEFLGDAILDFLITCFIFEMCDNLTPGDLTDLRSALVNNNTFASFVVRLGLHKYLLLMSSKLQHLIDNFVDFCVTKKDYVIDEEVLILLEEDDLKLAEYVDVPKALGDLFEAVAGAIFMDSNYSLETVWNVFYRIMWNEINSFSANVPKNVVRQLFEKEGVFPEFEKAVEVGNGTVMIKLNFLAEGRPKYVHGFGSNKALAKKAAAKIALRNL